jgi:hypothetical protein
MGDFAAPAFHECQPEVPPERRKVEFIKPPGGDTTFTRGSTRSFSGNSRDSCSLLRTRLAVWPVQRDGPTVITETDVSSGPAPAYLIRYAARRSRPEKRRIFPSKTALVPARRIISMSDGNSFTDTTGGFLYLRSSPSLYFSNFAFESGTVNLLSGPAPRELRNGTRTI